MGWLIRWLFGGDSEGVDNGPSGGHEGETSRLRPDGSWHTTRWVSGDGQSARVSGNEQMTSRGGLEPPTDVHITKQ